MNFDMIFLLRPNMQFLIINQILQQQQQNINKTLEYKFKQIKNINAISTFTIC